MLRSERDKAKADCNAATASAASARELVASMRSDSRDPPAAVKSATSSLSTVPASSIFNDGSDEGFSHENRVLREHLREAEATLQRHREDHAHAVAVR